MQKEIFYIMIIYKVINNVNKKVYIGQTIRELRIRKRCHKYTSDNNSSSYFHRAIRKYGWDSFEWKVLCECRTKEEMDEMEKKYIKQYKSHSSENGYNMTWGGDGGNGLFGEDNPMSKPEVKNIHHKAVIRLSKTPEWIQAHKEGCMKYGRDSFIVISPNNEMQIIKGICEFCQDNNLLQPKMSEVANGGRRVHKNWKCFHYDEAKRMKAWKRYIKMFGSRNNTFKTISSDGTVCYSDNVTEFARYNNIRRSNIYSVLNNKQQSHKGWSFVRCDIQNYIDYIEDIISQSAQA